MKTSIALVILAFLVPASAQVTLSARVKIISSVRQKESPRADNVVVWLEAMNPVPDPRPFPGGPYRLTQHNKSFEPHLLVVPVGATVQFPNRDPFFHNVFSLFEGKRFDLGLYEAGTSRNVSFDRPGISYIFCNIHAEMSAVVIALETPYFGISSRQGEIVIPSVPAGRYVMHVWYETALPSALADLTREIEVGEGSSTLGILQVPSAPLREAHKNKYGLDYEPAVPPSPGYEQH